MSIQLTTCNVLQALQVAQDEGWVTCAHCEQEFASYHPKCPCCGADRIDLRFGVRPPGDEVPPEFLQVDEAQLDRYWRDMMGLGSGLRGGWGAGNRIYDILGHPRRHKAPRSLTNNSPN
jgi:hypothetical protein